MTRAVWPTLSSLCLLPLLLSPALAGFAPITLNALDSPLIYRPRFGRAYGGWSLRYTEKEWNPDERHQVGEGFSYAITWHNASMAPPWINYTFYGTGAAVWGLWGDAGVKPLSPGGSGAVRLSLTGAGDGAEPAVALGNGTGPAVEILDLAEPGELARVDRLPLDWYTLILEVVGGTVSVTHIVADMWVGGTAEEAQAASDDPVRLYSANASGTGWVRNDAFGEWAGRCWTTAWRGQTVGSDCLGDAVTVPLGAGNAFVRVEGTTGRDYNDDFQVTLDPLPPGHDIEPNFNRRFWERPNTALFARGLDPAQAYNLTVAPLAYVGTEYPQGGQMKWPVAISAVTLWKLNDQPTKNGSSEKRLTLAIALGVTLGLVVLLALFFLLLHRRHRVRRARNGPNVFDSQEAVDLTDHPTPPHQLPSLRVQTTQHMDLFTGHTPSPGDGPHSNASSLTHSPIRERAPGSYFPPVTLPPPARSPPPSLAIHRLSLPQGLLTNLTVQETDAEHDDAHPLSSLHIPPAYDARWAGPGPVHHHHASAPPPPTSPAHAPVSPSVPPAPDHRPRHPSRLTPLTPDREAIPTHTLLERKLTLFQPRPVPRRPASR